MNSAAAQPTRALEVVARAVAAQEAGHVEPFAVRLRRHSQRGGMRAKELAAVDKCLEVFLDGRTAAA